MYKEKSREEYYKEAESPRLSMPELYLRRAALSTAPEIGA